MKEKINKGSMVVIVIIVLAILGLVGFVVYQSMNTSKTMTRSETVSEDQMIMRNSGVEESEKMMMENNGGSKSAGKYIVYTPENFEMYSQMRRVLFFYANWCPICKPADANFKANIDKLPEDLVLIRVNYNDSDTDKSEEAIAEKYGITYQHTFVQIDENGAEVTKWNGSSQVGDLLEHIK